MGDDRVPPPSPSTPHVSVRQVTTTMIRPATPTTPKSPATPTRCELTSWDLPLLLTGYIQQGQLYSIPTIADDIDGIVDRLKNSLAKALLHFYPAAGRLATEKATDDGVSGLFMYINCNNEGAQFVHSVADGISVDDVLKPLYVPSFVNDFFSLTGAINLDGHTLPLVGVQVTQLTDGIFLGVSMNHVVGDGTAFWNFMRGLADISRGIDDISQPPVHSRLFVEDTPIPIRLPYANHEDMVERYIPPKELVKRVFHFTSSFIARLKDKANDHDVNVNGTKKIVIISSFQALIAHVCRSITRARRLAESELTFMAISCSNRHRLMLSPPLSQSYFGNCFSIVTSYASVAELQLEFGLQLSAKKVHESVASWTDDKIREDAKRWTSNPELLNFNKLKGNVIGVGNSPRFEMYCEFGWGKALAVRSASAHMVDGKVTAFPGREGGGSVDLEICLLRETMIRLEMDQEFRTSEDLEDIYF